MRKSEKKKKRSPAALMAIGLALVVGLLAFGLGRETLRSRQIDREIEALRSEAERLRVKNFEISSLSRALDDEEYLEREARLKLNLRKEGERVVVLTEIDGARPGLESARASEERSSDDDWSNPKKWWAYFFDRDAYEDRASLRDGNS